MRVFRKKEWDVFWKIYLIASFHACSYSLGGLIGEFNGHLEEPDGKFLMNLGRHPQSEGVINVLGLNQYVDYFRTETQR